MKRLVGNAVFTALLGMATLGASAGTSLAQAATVRDDVPSTYVVVRGDTLWDISGRFLREPWLWPEVWRANPQIKNPHLIYPGDRISLYYENGEPRLRLERGQGGVVKLSPKIRKIPKREAVPPIPLEKISAFLKDHRVVDPGLLENAPYVVAGDDTRLISGAGDTVYARGQWPAYDTFSIYRTGQRYLDPVTQEFLGLEMISIGDVQLERREGDIGVMHVVSANREILNGDLLLPADGGAISTSFQPQPPVEVSGGEILAAPDGLRNIGRNDIVALNRGSRDGVEPGFVFGVERQGETITDPKTGEPITLPGEEGGLLMVFRIYDKVSYALVMKAERPLSVGDKLLEPHG
ncbi:MULTISPECIES: LysM peptidoglycan-binding domain-containing protein [Cobetia]|uniref:LysM domain-containing protein n=1 Tax=Cobetia marina TaxID=28258 RepID=A0ABU9GGQ8_COBMA|nr:MULTISPECIES: LysM domain-containing protein [Cobetia]MDA5565152.1 LysM domain-containing protein [Cobetia sp. MMG027]MDH2292868.1 LysM domain-containing protein [Cobetia sp. 10Alg 146]MDH2375284.1 LysM domain-containing protein [Cobetia sp. 3AK]MDI6004928.1 LysM domain-containing protein [Cobetia pacifica]